MIAMFNLVIGYILQGFGTFYVQIFMLKGNEQRVPCLMPCCFLLGVWVHIHILKLE